MITPFEYVTVLISIILGMGLTQIVSGFAAVVIRWERIRLYWPHTILVFLVFVIHIQDWWATYELIHFRYWRLPTFLFIILYPVNLYILTRILFPHQWGKEEIDLKRFYLDNYRRIFLFMLFLPAHSILDNHFIGGYPFSDQVLQIVLVGIMAIPVFVVNTSEFVLKVISIILLLALVGSMVVEWNTFLILDQNTK